MRNSIVIVAFLLFGNYLYAAENPKWTLEECMAYAAEHSPSMAIRTANNEIIRQNYRDAVMALLPSVNASVSAGFGYGRSLDVDNTYKNVDQFSNDYGIGASLNLFSGMGRVNRIKMEKVNRLTGRYQEDAERDMLMYDVMEAFMQVQYCREAVELARQELLKSANDLRQTERMVELGVKGYPDQAEMQAKEAEDRHKLTQRQNILRISVILLKEKMNFPIEEELETEDYGVPSDLPEITSTALEIYGNSLDFLPKALMAESALESSRFSYKTAKSQMYPSLWMNAGVSSNYFTYLNGTDPAAGFWNQVRDKRGQHFGFSLSIPIFDRLQRSSAVRRSRIEYRIASYRRDEQLSTLYREIEQALADVTGFAEEWRQSGKRLEAVSVAHAVNRRKYEEGLISALELHTSANRLMEAKMQDNYTRMQYFIKYKLINYYTGEPFLDRDAE